MCNEELLLRSKQNAKSEIRDSLKRNFLSQKIFRPPKVIFCCVGCFFEWGMFPASQKGTFGDENLLREKISFEKISHILRFVLTSTIPFAKHFKAHVPIPAHLVLTLLMTCQAAWQNCRKLKVFINPKCHRQ